MSYNTLEQNARAVYTSAQKRGRPLHTYSLFGYKQLKKGGNIKRGVYKNFAQNTRREINPGSGPFRYIYLVREEGGQRGLLKPQSGNKKRGVPKSTQERSNHEDNNNQEGEERERKYDKEGKDTRHDTIRCVEAR